jgi:hypothetical protein
VRVALESVELTVESAIVKITSLGPVAGAALVVVAEWVTAAHFLRAVRSVTVCRRLHPIACICIVVAVAWFNVVFTALISRNTEVSAPAIGAFYITISAALRWAFHVDWMTEWTLVAVADLVVLTALRFSAVMGWALLVCWMAIRPIRPVAHLAVVPAVWIASAPLTEASLHVAELVWLTLVIRLTGSAALIEGEAAEVWVLTDPIAVAWADVHVALLREAGAFVWIAEVALWAVLLDVAG